MRRNRDEFPLPQSMSPRTLLSTRIQGRSKASCSALIVLAGSATLLLGCGSGGAATDSTSSAGSTGPSSVGRIAELPFRRYPALRLPGPSGITVISPSQARRRELPRRGPVWPNLSPKDTRLIVPRIATAREVSREGSRRIWIAESSRGGICLLLFDPATTRRPAQDHSVNSACGDRSEMADGVLIESRVDRQGPRTVLVGLVPQGVRRVEARGTGGKQHSIKPSNGLYQLTVSEPLATLTIVGRRSRQLIKL